MHRQTSKRICQFLSLLVVVANVCALRNIQAQTPNADSGGTTYTLTDEATPVHSGIVWGASPVNYRDCDFTRAGNPQCQRKITIPSNTRFYGGYYVGGGTPTRGAGRCIEDGTWGWDYAGILFTKRIALNWTAKGRAQGGTGSYKTDGPKLRRE